MKNTEVASLFKTIADSFMALSEIYSSATEQTEQPKATAKKEKPVKKGMKLWQQLMKS